MQTDPRPGSYEVLDNCIGGHKRTCNLMKWASGKVSETQCQHSRVHPRAERSQSGSKKLNAVTLREALSCLLFVQQSMQTRAIVPKQCSSLNLFLTKCLCSVPHHWLAVSSSSCHGIEALYKAIIAVTLGFVVSKTLQGHLLGPLLQGPERLENGICIQVLHSFNS